MEVWHDEQFAGVAWSNLGHSAKDMGTDHIMRTVTQASAKCVRCQHIVQQRPTGRLSSLIQPPPRKNSTPVRTPHAWDLPALVRKRHVAAGRPCNQGYLAVHVLRWRCAENAHCASVGIDQTHCDRDALWYAPSKCSRCAQPPRQTADRVCRRGHL